MNTLKKFSGETHKGWASFQAWIKKWNKIMAVIFSALGIILLLSTVIVNALEVHEENQDLLKPKNENPRLNLFEVCQRVPMQNCRFNCNAGTPTEISMELNHHWETNPDCQLNGMTIQISSAVHFPMFRIPTQWLNGSFQLKELHIDVENIFEICENAFTGTIFDWMQELVLTKLHLDSLDAKVLQKLFVDHHYERLTLTKNSSNKLPDSATIELHVQHKVLKSNDLDDTVWIDGNKTQAVIITLSIVGCILSFTLGLFIRCNRNEQQAISSETSNTNRMIFVVEDSVNCLKDSSFVVENEKCVDKILSKNPFDLPCS